MRYPWANPALLLLLSVQIVTGLGGLLRGSQASSWVFWLHGLVAYAIALLLFWKGAVVLQTIRRSPALTAARLGFLVLTVLLLATLATGFAWSYGGPYFFAGFSLLTLHGFLAMGLVGLLAWHTLAKRFVWRMPSARNRRAALRLAGITVAGAALWRLAKPVKAALALPGAERRFTGSYETGSFSGVFPYVSWLFDNPAPIDVSTWRLHVGGAVAQPLTLTFAELIQLADTTRTVTLDCTGGWYSHQEWRGVPVGRLLARTGINERARSITVTAISGYYRRFSLAEAGDYLLVTHVAGQPLGHGHGAPLRLVAPGRRGFEWVKWVTTLWIDQRSPHWQPPLPLQ